MGLGERKPLPSSPQLSLDLPPPSAGQSPLYSMVWDATCSDMHAPSYLAQSTMTAGAVASQIEDVKKVKYSLIW